MTIIGKAKNGSPTIIKDGYYLISSYNPENEIDRFVESQGDVNGQFFILFGSALGYMVNALVKKGVNNNDILVYEPDPVCSEFMADKLKDYILLDRGLTDYGLFERMLSERKKPRVLALESFRKLYPDDYSEFSVRLSRAVGIAAENIKVSSYFSKVWFINFIRNLAFFMDNENCSCLQDIRGKIQTDVLICAAGPSLNRSLDEIRDNMDNLILISVLPAAVTLMESGIRPDFVIVSDGGVYNKILGSGLPPDIPVLASIYSSSSLLSPLGNSKLFYDLEYSLENMEFSLKYPSVAIDAGVLANMISSGSVIFAGLDLAYSKRSGSHSSGNLFREMERSASDRLRTFHTKNTSFLARRDIKALLDDNNEYFSNDQLLLIKETAVKMFAGNSFVSGGADFPGMTAYDSFKNIELSKIDKEMKTENKAEIKGCFSRDSGVLDRIKITARKIREELESIDAGFCSRVFVRESLMNIPLEEISLYYGQKLDRLFHQIFSTSAPR